MTFPGWTDDVQYEPPDDHLRWMKPAAPACPRCRCCSARLCGQAERQGTSCAWESREPADFDLTRCPCRPVPGAAPDPSYRTPKAAGPGADSVAS